MSARKTTIFSLMASLTFAGVVLFGCGEPSDKPSKEAAEDQEVTLEDVDGAAVSERKEAIKKIFYTIPAPMEMASLIQESGADFDGEILNSVENVSNYMTRNQRALNLGVYGANLSYTTMFERSKESLYYLSAVRQLADQLGASNIINDNLINRVETNKEQKDSLLSIVSDTFWSLNAKFKEDGMEDISALVITGGWVEALYLASAHVENNDELRQRVAEQKYSLNDLVKLIDTYENQENLAEVRSDLKALQEIFDDVQINKGKTETSVDDSGTTVIGGAKAVTMSDETLARVIEKAGEIRNRYIQ